MKTLKCWAKVDYNIEWTGTPDQLVDFMDRMSHDVVGEGLDSLDLGDAMGFIMGHLDKVPGGFTWKCAYGILKAEKNYDTFIWDNLTDTQSNMIEELKS